MAGMRLKSPWIDAAERRAREMFETLAHGDWDALDKATQDLYFRAVVNIENEIRPFRGGLRLQDFANGSFVPYWCEVWESNSKYTVFDLRLDMNSGIYIKDGRKYAGVRSIHLYFYSDPKPNKLVKVVTNDFKDVWISESRLFSEREIDWLSSLYREAADYMGYFNKPEYNIN